MKYLIYTRVSERGSDWAGETSCAAQADECRRYMAQAHPGSSEVGPPIEDEFKTGTNNKRPGLKSILEECNAGSSRWETLVVLDIDRLVRSMEGYVDLLRVLQKAGAALVAIRQDVDMTTPSGRFLMHMLVASAEFFAGQNASKTRDKMLWIARQGMWPAGGCPMGYKRAGVKDNRLVPDPVESARVVAIFEDAARGHHITEMCRTHRLPKNTLIKVLRNPIVRGRIVYGGVDVVGLHPPIIDLETWERVQALHTVRPVKDQLPRPSRQHYQYLLTGLVRCSCGRSMSPATCKGRHGGKFPYYRCQDTIGCSRRSYVRADLLEMAVKKQFTQISLDTTTLEAIAAGLSERVASASRDVDQAAVGAVAALAEARIRRQRLLDAIGSGQLTGAALSDVNGVLGELSTSIAKWERDTENAKRVRPVWTVEKVMQAMASLIKSAEGFGDNPAMMSAWMRSHVRTITPRDDGTWSMAFELPGGSTSTYQWHPLGALVELIFRVEKLVA